MLIMRLGFEIVETAEGARSSNSIRDPTPRRRVRVTVLWPVGLYSFWKFEKGRLTAEAQSAQGYAESLNQISAPPLRPLRLCGESPIQCYQTERYS